ncbi:MAG: M91 family zinc metallopeptidase [Stackebrandtia sp.]
MVEPKINVDLQWFDLKADPAKLEKAAEKWRGMGTKGDTVGDNLHKAANKVLDATGQEWKGDTRDTFETHKTALITSMTGTKGKANDVGGALDGLATLLRNRQGDLDSLKSKLRGRVANVISGNQITFSPANPKETKGVKDAVEAARGIRDGLDTQLGTHTSALTKAVGEWEAVSTKWKKYAADNAPAPFKLPPEADNGSQTIKLPDGTVIVNTGTGDEETDVRTDGDGNVIVTVDGKEYKYPPGTPIAIRGGEGDDNVSIKTGVDTDITVLGGEGKDQITDNDLPGQEASTGPRTVIGGDGSDSIVVNGENKNVSAGAGDDEVIAIGDDNNVSTGDGKDDVRTTGGYVSTGRADDFVRAGNHNDNPFLKDADVHDVTIFGGEGNEEIQGSTSETGDKISGGSGEDEIYGHEGGDLISGDADQDYIDGQDGNDNISGGEDTDTIYGLDGDDTIAGGSGEDYLEGAEGNDAVNGGTGDDVVSGGRGDDTLHGDDGTDVLYAGDGKDSVDGGEGDDKAFVQDEDRVATDKVASNGYAVSDTDTVKKVDIVDSNFVKVDGSDEFEDRVRADLNMLAGSENGSKMLTNLSDNVSKSHNDIWPGERELVINEFDEDNGTAHPGLDGFAGSDVNININPEYDSGNEKPPATVLYHELGHAYDYYNDTSDLGRHEDPNDPDYVREKKHFDLWGPEERVGAKNSERQAAGLPIDHDVDPNTPTRIDPDHPIEYTENGLRDEMNWGHRYHYGSPS